jgi:hypothetical protein
MADKRRSVRRPGKCSFDQVKAPESATTVSPTLPTPKMNTRTTREKASREIMMLAREGGTL